MATAKPAKRARASKKAAELDGKANQTATLRKLETDAKEINTRFEKVAKLDGQADDHRLAAAIRLAEVKSKCEEAKIPFQKWCDDNITDQSFRTLRQLAGIGAQPEPRLALEDLRGKNKEANQKLRDAKKERTSTSTSKPQGSTGPTEAPFTRAENFMATLDEKTRDAVMEATAHKVGKVLVPADAAKEVAQSAKLDPLARAKAVFDALRPADKVALLRYAADETGFSVVSDDADLNEVVAEAAPVADDDGPGEIPEFLQRPQPKKKASRTKK